jgi:hypothetical protein|tara:strand:+ start:228 stop:443 length:216 start_codon:yes stop_codon:yes gene_type:complete
MDYFKGTKTQISPCIAAKAKFALNPTKKKPSNTKTCSYVYWCRVIETISSQKNLSGKTAEEAKNKFKPLIK